MAFPAGSTWASNGWFNRSGTEMYTLGWFGGGVRDYDPVHFWITQAIEQSAAIAFSGWYNGLTQVIENNFAFDVEGEIQVIYAPARDESQNISRRKRTIDFSQNRTLKGGRKRR